MLNAVRLYPLTHQLSKPAIYISSIVDSAN